MCEDQFSLGCERAFCLLYLPNGREIFRVERTLREESVNLESLAVNETQLGGQGSQETVCSWRWRSETLNMKYQHKVDKVN